MYKDLFKRIIDASKNNSLTFFVGAGVSKLSNAPKWSELIDDFCDYMGRAKKEYSNEEYLSIPQMFYYSIDKDDNKYYEFVNNCFDKTELKTNSVHKLMFDFNPNAIITTNFDDLLEKAAIENCQSFKSVACDSEIGGINGDKFILKLHGDLKHKNIVLKEEDYLNYSENFKLTETLLKSIFSTNTVVFIGYGLNDYNIKLVLNWTKTLLKDNFNKPIFIYTDDADLTLEELKYHESKGVNVIEYKKCFDGDLSKIEFKDKYECVLNSIKKSSKLSLEGKNDIEAFEVLYSLLKPLNEMKALRIQDVRRILGSDVIIDTIGVINVSSRTTTILEYFISLTKMTDAERENLPEDIIDKFNTIVSVFSKARITRIYQEHKYINIPGNECCFADETCISFNYVYMHSFVSKTYSEDCDNYKKAYYLAKLHRHDEAYRLFTEVAINAFKNNNYLLHFLAQANRNTLYTSMKSINGHLLYMNYYDLDNVVGGRSDSDRVEYIFEKLPLEFQNQYYVFKNLTSFNLLFENSYYSFVDGMKLQDTIESKTMEMGLTSSDKVICRINNNLHFFLGNGLYMEEFAEFKNTIKNLMSLLVYKYSVQGKKISNDDEGIFDQGKIYFDQIDFYCFIEYFNAKELVKVFSQYEIETLDFHNSDIVNKSILNMIEYYEKVLYKSKKHIEILGFQNRLKTCLTLLRYVKLEQSTVDKLCEFIFKYDFREIRIDEKVLFLDRQLYKRQMYSTITAKVIEDALVHHIDSHTKTIDEKQEYHSFSGTTSINYYNLVHYISPEKKASRRLSIRVSRIISNSAYKELRSAVTDHYYEYLSEYQQAKVICWVKNIIKEKFDMDLFNFLISYNIKMDRKIITEVKKFLKTQTTRSDRIPGLIYPHANPYGELEHIGYLCFVDYLKRKDFKKFLGMSNLFDFFYLCEKFDYSKFDISWLLNWNSVALEKISKCEKVRNKIRTVLANKLKADDINLLDKKKLSNILIRYFC